MRTAKVFSNGRSRAVRIPRDWLGNADEVKIRREGQSVVIEPLLPTMKEIAARFADDPIAIERLPQSKTRPKAL